MTSPKLSIKLKEDIFREVISQPNPFAESQEVGISKFLTMIWDLDSLPSTDDRFDTAREDLIHHTVGNNDWDYEFLFLERFKLFEAEEKFELFLEALMSPDIRTSEDDITKFYFLLNPYLKKEGVELAVTEFNSNNLPVYKLIKVGDRGDAPVDVADNNIPFVVVKNPNGNSAKLGSHTPPSEVPSFVLAFNEGWNDFQVKTYYDLFYYDENAEGAHIGGVKIMKLNHDNKESSLEDRFTHLSEDFCSVGQSIDYYSDLKKLFERNFTSVLFALKDAAFFPEINDKFENNSFFKGSLIRFDSAERLLREAKYLVYGYDLSNLYSFGYDFKPKFADSPLRVTFNFDNNSESPDRIYALIGKNATGKTQLITSLPIDIAKGKNEVFTPRTPLFSKVVAVSYSVFDSFEVPASSSSFNYKYCGLKDSDGQLVSDHALKLRFHITWKRIKYLGRMNDWKDILQNFIDSELLDSFIVPDDVVENALTVNIEEFGKVRRTMSSGQNILLYVISEIVANIRYDSLILFDEPETHLHPNAVSQLVNAISDLVNKFESYCIMATHSPLIIRELLSKNVLVIEREGNVASIRKIGIESFGENLTLLTDEVFGNRAIPKQHKIVIKKLVNDGKTYEEIVSLLESDSLPLSLNALMAIRSLTN